MDGWVPQKPLRTLGLNPLSIVRDRLPRGTIIGVHNVVSAAGMSPTLVASTNHL